MHELLIPGRQLILQAAAADGAKGSGSRGRRATAYSLAAARYRGKIIPLRSLAANAVARDLIVPALYPDATEYRSEPLFDTGSHRARFDGRFRAEGREHLIEVKACTLVEHGVGMFPDAPSARALRHIETLAGAVDHGFVPHLLFVLAHPDAEYLVPNIHTDPAFATRLAELSSVLGIHAVSLSVGAEGRAQLADRAIPVGLDPVRLVTEDRGNYLALFRLDSARSVRIGSGKSSRSRELAAGYYVYAGSAHPGLRARMRRHGRGGTKRLRWHVDYLAAAADHREVFAIYTPRNLECDLAHDVAGAALAAGGHRIPRFGAGDCACPSHLAYFPEHPLASEEFVTTLFSYRHAPLRSML
jgi:sugar fermentation stimulation protein A